MSGYGRLTGRPALLGLTVLLGLAACGAQPASAPQAAPTAPPAIVSEPGSEAAAAARAADVASLADTRLYACENGARIRVRYTQAPHQAQVWVDNGLPAILAPRIAASGIQFVGPGMALHSKGAEVLWSDFMKPQTRCREVAR